MKKGKQLLFIFISVLLLVTLINSFVYNILYGLRMPIFLALALIIFRYLFGFEKSRFRVTKDVILDTIVFVTIFLLLYYLFGLVSGFARVGNYYSWAAMRDYVLPVAFISVIREILRYNYLVKIGNDKTLLIIGVITFILIEVSNSIYFGSFNSGVQVFKYFALTLLPAISFNAYATYAAKNSGYSSTMIYSLIMGLYPYLIPVIPDGSEYVVSIIKLLLPVIILYRIYLTVKNESDEKISRDYNKKDYISLSVATIVVAVLVYFSSGYFKYYAVAIATGSMSPNIKVGDVVVIKKTDDYENIKVGEIIAYDYHDHLIVHRLINKIEVEGRYYFYSKGDANKDEDNYVIDQEMIIGTTNIKIPYLGLPTVWLNRLREE